MAATLAQATPTGRHPRPQWSLVPDFGEALAQVQEGAGTVLVTGSFHTVGDDGGDRDGTLNCD